MTIDDSVAMSMAPRISLNSDDSLMPRMLSTDEKRRISASASPASTGS